jgi:tetratricopeptide (TPR) repeat protein
MGEAAPETCFRVFVSAPDDVAAERALVGRVCNFIAEEFGGRVRFLVHQGGMECQHDRPSTSDIVICVLWKALGTTLPPPFDRPDGTHRTAIEFEFEDALDSALQRETPDILVYKKRVIIDVEQAEEVAAELQALNGFWQKWFRNERGHFTASFDSFDGTDEFAEKLQRHLRQWVLRRRQDVVWPVALRGSPYRSLEAFDVEHASVFFGRRIAVRQVAAKLAAAAARGCAFLVVLGGSGTGKSSLVRAGVLPWLTGRGVVSDVAVWRTAIVRPAACGAAPLLGLARAFFAQSALPELVNSDYPDAERLAGLAARSAEAAAIVIAAALRMVQPGCEARVLLLVDQLEEISALTADARDAFAAWLDALARGGRVWVVATLRSDRYPALQASLALVRLKEDGDSFDLLPPDQAEIREIIEGPARAAGLKLEDNGERSLADLLEAASRERGALPLLQFTLHRLFVERDAARATLLLSAYDRLGGLAGAIAGEAEKTVAALPDRLQAALPPLLLSLVAVTDSKKIASARTIQYSDVVDDASRALADRLVEGRFLVLEGGGATTTLRLAHEALLTHWPRLADLVREHGAFLATRTQLNTDAAHWTARDRHPDFLLAPGRLLAAAADALAHHRAELDPASLEFVEASLEAERRRVAERQAAERQALQLRAEAAEARARAARRLVARTRIAAGVVGVLLLAMAGTAALWLSQLMLARQRTVQAEMNYATALKAASDGVRVVAQARAAGQVPNDVANELLDATKRTFEQLGSTTQPADILSIKAEMFNQIAQADYLAGKFSDALAALRQELALAQEIARREPDNAKWQWSLIQAHESLGQWSEQAGDLPAAAAQYQAMTPIAAAMVAKLPDNVAWQHWKFVALAHQAEHARATGDLPRAVAGFHAALDHFAAATQRASATQVEHYILGATRLGLARAILAQGDISGAISQRRAALAGFTQLSERNPSNHNWRFAMSLAQAELGDGLRVDGALDAAADMFHQSIAIEQSLGDADKSNYLLRNNLRAAERGLADVMVDQGRSAEALKLYRSELDTIKSLAEHDPANSFWQRNLAHMHGRVGDGLRDAHDDAAAEQEYRAGLAVIARLAAQDPTNTDWARDLSLAHARLGTVLRAKGDVAGAANEYRARLAIVMRLTQQDPTNVNWRRDLAAAHGQLALASGSREEFAACAAQPPVLPDTDTTNNRPENMQGECATHLK